MIDRTQQLPVGILTDYSLPRPVTTRLANGMTMHLMTDPTMEPVCRLTMILPGGIAEAANPAAARLAATQLREGTASVDGARIADMIDTSGAWLKASSTSHSRIVVMNCITRKLRENASLLSLLISEPAFPDGALAVHREREAARIEVESQKVSYKASQRMSELMFGSGHPLARILTAAEARAVIRDELWSFHYSYLRPSAISLYVAGNISPQMVDELADVFGSLAPSELAAGSCDPDIVEMTPCEPCVCRVPDAEARQSCVMVELPAIRRNHPDYVALRMTVTALGGYFGSRLMTNIREDKGYTYGISASLLGMHEGGAVRVATECDPRYVEATIAEIGAEMRRLADDPPRGDELERMRGYVRTQLVSVLDNALTRLGYYIDGELSDFDAFTYYESQRDLVNTITPGLIADMARRYLNPSKAITVIAGPTEKADKQ